MEYEKTYVTDQLDEILKSAEKLNRSVESGKTLKRDYESRLASMKNDFDVKALKKQAEFNRHLESNSELASAMMAIKKDLDQLKVAATITKKIATDNRKNELSLKNAALDLKRAMALANERIENLENQLQETHDLISPDKLNDKIHRMIDDKLEMQKENIQFALQNLIYKFVTERFKQIDAEVHRNVKHAINRQIRDYVLAETHEKMRKELLAFEKRIELDISDQVKKESDEVNVTFIQKIEALEDSLKESKNDQKTEEIDPSKFAEWMKPEIKSQVDQIIEEYRSKSPRPPVFPKHLFN